MQDRDKIDSAAWAGEVRRILADAAAEIERLTPPSLPDARSHWVVVRAEIQTPGGRRLRGSRGWIAAASLGRWVVADGHKS
jgi:hypothetical protein